MGRGARFAGQDPRTAPRASRRVGNGSPDMKRILFVTYHFPPQKGSSGLLRSLKFCRYLPETGWLPVVLTVHPRAYERVDNSQLGEIPPEVDVIRSFALDARRHLALR